MSSALEICQKAIRRANTGQPLNSLTGNTQFPYTIVIDLLNKALSDIEELGALQFLMGSQLLTYSPSSYTYNLSSLGVDPNRVTALERTLVTKGRLHPYNYESFRYAFRFGTIETTIPSYYTIWGDTLELATQPDQDYGLTLYYLSSLTRVTQDTDTFVLPENDEEVLIQGVYAYVIGHLGRDDAETAFAFYQRELNKLKRKYRRYYHIGRRLPSAF